jgi:hypothetical protein
MPPPDPAGARFTTVSANSGHYESFYVKLCHPDRPLGAWVRYTVHKRPGAAPKGSLWFTLFDAEADGPRASKATTAELGAGGGDWLRVGDSAIGAGRAAGAAPNKRCYAAWDLRFESAEAPLFHLPANFLYRAPLPRTKLLSPAPAARFEGRLTIDGDELDVGGWRGMVGHNWGAQHAERWIWLHGLGFAGAGEGTWLDAAIGRIKVGPATTPWIANGALSLDGERIALGGLGRRASVSEQPDRCEFTLPGRGARVRGEVRSPQVVGWVYADPDGSEHSSLNCSIADMTLDVERDGASPLRLELSGGAAYELGVRERDHGIELQPFPDG